MMRSLIFAGAIAALCVAGPALAAGRASGTVVSVNPTAGIVVLADGRSFVFSDREALQKVAPGESININFFGEGQGLRTFDPCLCGGGSGNDQP